MEGFITHLPQTLIGWISFIVAFIFSIVLAYLAFIRQRNGADDRLIKILQGTVEELEKKVGALEDEQGVLVKKVAELKTTNDTLTKILQGRDESTVAFQAEAKIAMDLSKETNRLVKQTSESVARLADILEKHYNKS